MKNFSYIVSDFNKEYIGLDVVISPSVKYNIKETQVFTIEADYTFKDGIEPLSFEEVSSDVDNDYDIVVESFDVYDQDGQITYKLDEIYSEIELESMLTKAISDHIMFSQILEG